MLATILAALVFLQTVQQGGRPVSSARDTVDYAAALGRTVESHRVVDPALALSRDGRWVATTVGERVTVVSSDGRKSHSVLPTLRCTGVSWLDLDRRLLITCKSSVGRGYTSIYLWRLGSGIVDSVDSADWLHSSTTPPVPIPGTAEFIYATQENLVPPTRAAQKTQTFVVGGISLPDSARCFALGMNASAGLCSDTVDILRSRERAAHITPPGNATASLRQAGAAAAPDHPVTRVVLYDSRTRTKRTVARIRGNGQIRSLRPLLDRREFVVRFRPSRNDAATRVAVLSLSPKAESDSSGQFLEADSSGRLTLGHGALRSVDLLNERRGREISISPDGETLAWVAVDTTAHYATQRASDTLYMASSSDGKSVAIALALPSASSDSSKMLQWYQRESLRWTPNGNRLVVANRGTIWSVDRRSGKARPLVGESRYLASALPYISDRDALVTAVDVWTGRSSAWWIDLANGHWDHRAALPNEVMWDAYAAMQVFGARVGNGRNVVLAYVGRSNRTLPNAFAVRFNSRGDRENPVRQLTHREVPVKVPRTNDTLVTYRISPTQWGAGVLMRPAGATGPLPTIIQAYPDRPSVFRRLHAPGLLLWGDAFAAIARGFAVLLVDVPLEPYPSYGPDGPAAGIVRGMTAAIQAFARTGWIDTTRLGVTGQSYGGYMVNLLITNTELFRAAVSLAGPSDLVSGSAGGTEYGPRWFVTSQGRMGKSLAEAPERYVLNSPVLHLDRVKAPLLLVHGVRDMTVHISQSEEMFRGLSINRKPVELVRYHDEGHTGDRFLRAAWLRGLDWFDQYLK